MSIPGLTDADIDALLPKCEDEPGVEQIHQKQYRFARKCALDLIRQVRPMLAPLPEADRKAVLKPLATFLQLFLAAKLGKLRHTPIKPAKAVPVPPPAVPTENKPAGQPPEKKDEK
jgi:hypothetical protein